MKIELPNEKLVIPSGIVSTTSDIIKVLEDIEGLGVITTKSIGLFEREGYKEPVIAGVGGSLVNAIGLANPGIDEHIKEIKEIYPIKKILMTSIFGSSAEEFVEITMKLEKYTDWIELNLSCPNVEGYGIAIGSSPKLVKEIVSSVRDATDLPIFVKLPPMPGYIGHIAKIAIKAGANGITAINTIGPLIFLNPLVDKPILSNIYGGLSGIAIKEIALMCIREIREKINVPIIGMGGISTPKDIEDFKRAGANLFGIGTALMGMSTDKLKSFIKELSLGRISDRPKVPLEYKEFEIKEIWGSDTTKVLILNGSIEALPGQFVFVWIPNIGEKPFSLAYNNPITLLVKKVGPVTSHITSLREGDKILIRGPYGNFYIPNSNVNLVAGGTGVAPIHFIAKAFKDKVSSIFIGGKSISELPLYDSLREITDVKVATEDGSLGIRGLVTDIIELNNGEYFNCGPEKMLIKASEIESKAVSPCKIFCSVERYMKCGIGICGSCALDGLRTCVDGPVIPYSILKIGKDFGNYKRSPSGRRIKIE
ncbi:MAG: dihydroorotate dehydrogenase electron transfer subunit [Candidatus Methanomethylicia archaeon]|nr:dihydroorotate dehydrogenase electron transfer subunit [Candidatus Methanomethylicia archaeon]